MKAFFEDIYIITYVLKKFFYQKIKKVLSTNLNTINLYFNIYPLTFMISC